MECDYFYQEHMNLFPNREERTATSSKITSLESELASVNDLLTTIQQEKHILEKECEGVRNEVEKVGGEKELMEEKIEELKKEVAAKVDDVQAKTKMIAKVCIVNMHVCLCTCTVWLSGNLMPFTHI